MKIFNYEENVDVKKEILIAVQYELYQFSARWKYKYVDF